VCPDNFEFNYNNILCTNVSQKYCANRSNEVSSQQDKSCASHSKETSSLRDKNYADHSLSNESLSQQGNSHNMI